MKLNNFFSLHSHSDNSVLDGFASIEEHIKHAKEMGHTAFALTDHESVSGHLDLQEAANKHGIKPIFGIETYLVEDRFSKLSTRQKMKDGKPVLVNGRPEYEKQKPKDFSHMCIWAKTQKGLENLWTLSALAFKEGYYYRARLDFDLLKKYNEGLIVSDGCLLSDVARFIIDDKIDEAKLRLSRLINIFGKENVVTEIHTWHFLGKDLSEEEQNLNNQIKKVNKVKVQLAKELGIKYVAVYDCHYAKREDYQYHNLTWKISTNDDQREQRHETASWNMTVKETIEQLMDNGLIEDEAIQAVYNVEKVAGQIEEVVIELKDPELIYDSEETDTELLKEAAYQGLIDRKIPSNQWSSYIKRLEHELDIIERKGFAGYFLIVQDYTIYAKDADPEGKRGPFKNKKPWLVAPGRGSAAGCLVSYLTRITEVDSIEHDLLFERFLDPERSGFLYTFTSEDGIRYERRQGIDHQTQDTIKRTEDLSPGDIIQVDDKEFKIKEKIIGKASAPDIDSDFMHSHREDLITYLKWRYGEDNIAFVGVNTLYNLKNSIKDIGKALGYSFMETNQITKELDQMDIKGNDSKDMTEEELIETLSEPQLKIYREVQAKYPQIFNLFDKFKTKVRGVGVHASGVVISKHSLVGKVPLRYKNGSAITGFNLRRLERVGYEKFDILATKILDVLSDTYKLANIEFNPNMLYSLTAKELASEAIWKGTNRGSSLGLFQLEANLLQRYAKNAKIHSLEDASVIIAAVRPGSLKSGGADRYIKKKNGQEPIKELHPMLTEVLAPTYGEMFYQEQLQFLLKDLAGIDFSESYRIFKFLGNSRGKEEGKFTERTLKSVESKTLANPEFIRLCNDRNPEEVFKEVWETVSGAMAYLFNKSHSLSYAMVAAYCAYVKEKYPAEFILSLLNNRPERLEEIITTAEVEYDIKLEEVDINLSKAEMSTDNGNIRRGFLDLKGVAGSAANSIVNLQPFSSFEDFLQRAKAKKNVTRALIISGAFDRFNPNRQELLNQFIEDLVMGPINTLKTEKAKERRLEELAPNYIEDHSDWLDLSTNNKIRRAMSEIVSYLPPLPLTEYQIEVANNNVSSKEKLEQAPIGLEITLAGKITQVREAKTKKGDLYGRVTLRLLDNTTVTVVYWPEKYKGCKDNLQMAVNSLKQNQEEPYLLQVRRDKDYSGDRQYTGQATRPIPLERPKPKLTKEKEDE
jgi:DNA polymerase-3 subunit alpha